MRTYLRTGGQRQHIIGSQQGMCYRVIFPLATSHYTRVKRSFNLQTDAFLQEGRPPGSGTLILPVNVEWNSISEPVGCSLHPPRKGLTTRFVLRVDRACWPTDLDLSSTIEMDETSATAPLAVAR
jgi:hypothetical protein